MRRIFRVAILLLAPFASSMTSQAHLGTGIDVDRQGRIYFADTIRDRICRIEPSGKLTVLATGMHTDFIAVDEDGNIYFSHDYFAGAFKSSFWKITPDGSVKEIRPATDAERQELSLKLQRKAHGPDGTLYFERQNQIVRRSPDGMESVLSGAARLGFAELGIDTAQVARPISVAADSVGNVFVVDSVRRRIAKITTAGQVTTVSQAEWSWWPTGVAVHDAEVYILERRGNYRSWSGPLLGLVANLVGNPRVRRISPDGSATTVATVADAWQRLIAGSLLAVIVTVLLGWRIRKRRLRKAT